MDSSQSTPRALATSTRPRGGRNAQRARLGLACIVEDVAERRHRRRVGLRVVLEKGVIDLRSEHGRACFCRRRFDTNSRGSDQRCDSPLLAWKVGSRAAGWSSSSSDSAKTAVTSITPLGPAAPPGGARGGRRVAPRLHIKKVAVEAEGEAIEEQRERAAPLTAVDGFLRYYHAIGFERIVLFFDKPSEDAEAIRMAKEHNAQVGGVTIHL